MNRKIIIIIALIIIGILLFYFIALPLLGIAPFTASLCGQWYDGENPVGSPFAFLNPGGSEVDRVETTVSWTSTGQNIDLSTFNLVGSTKCYLDQPYAGFEKTLLRDMPFQYSGENSMTRSAVQTFALESLLAGQMDWSPVGWTLVFEAHLVATITDDTGETLTSTWDGSITYKITWSEHAGTFSLTGTVEV